MSNIQTVGIVGAGTMGNGIAQDHRLPIERLRLPKAHRG